MPTLPRYCPAYINSLELLNFVQRNYPMPTRISHAPVRIVIHLVFSPNLHNKEFNVLNEQNKKEKKVRSNVHPSIFVKKKRKKKSHGACFPFNIQIFACNAPKKKKMVDNDDTGIHLHYFFSPFIRRPTPAMPAPGLNSSHFI